MRFLKLPNAVFDLDLEPMDFMVYCGIKSFCDKKLYAVVKAEKIAARIGVHRNSIYTAVKRLANLGLILPIARKQKHGLHANYRAANGYQFAELTGKWTKIPCNIFSYKLLPSRFMVYAYLQSRKNHAQRVFPSYGQITDSLNIDERTAENAVKELKSLELVKRKHYIRVISCFGHNNYTLLAVFRKIAGRIKKKVLQLFAHSRNTFFMPTIKLLAITAAYIQRKINIRFMNRHQFYRRI